MRKLTIVSLVLFIQFSIFAQSTLPPSVSSNGAVPVQNADSQKSALRTALISSLARNLKYQSPETAVSLVPANVSSPDEIKAILKKMADVNPHLVQQGNFCDPNFVGGLLGFTQTAELTMDDLLYQIHTRFGVNFLIGKGISNLPINIKSGRLPWNTILSSQLFLSGVRATCIGDNTIQLVSNTDLKTLQDNQEVKTRFIKLKYLQPTTRNTVDVAGRSSGGGGGGGGGQGCGGGGQGGGQGGGISGGGGGNQGCGNFEKLIFEIEKILGISSSAGGGGGIGGGGGQGGGTAVTSEPVRPDRAVSQVPGRNILLIKATEEEMELINQIIIRADRPPFQVVIKGLIYTANENLLRDIGVQTTIVASTADGRTSGSIFGNPISGAGTIFDFSTLIGTVDFNIQASALQQNGIIAIKSRPFATVLDGDPTSLEVGRQIPVLTQGSVVGGEAGNLVFIGASNLLSVTPFVIDDENGNPVAVNLDLQIESNEVDLSVISQGIPSVNRRSIQSRLILDQETTVVLGGFTVDSSNNTVSKTPGLGDIPILGYLFKRKVRSDMINRLYFAISVSIIPYGELIEPVKVPGATTDIPTIDPKSLKPLTDKIVTSDATSPDKEKKSKGKDKAQVVLNDKP